MQELAKQDCIFPLVKIVQRRGSQMQAAVKNNQEVWQKMHFRQIAESPRTREPRLSSIDSQDTEGSRESLNEVMRNAVIRQPSHKKLCAALQSSPVKQPSV